MPRVIPSVLNFVVPGMGFVVQRRWVLAAASQGVLYLLVAACCWTRLVILPVGCVVLMIGITVVHVSAAAASGWPAGRPVATPGRHSATTIRVIGAALLFGLAALLLARTAFVFKDSWLGVDINYVPSRSMAPALERGDYVLLDSWRSSAGQIGVGDIVVFSAPGSSARLVKRVSRVDRDGERVRLHVHGDNPYLSRDSRVFGAVPLDRVHGRVEIVLASRASDGSFRSGRWLRGAADL